MIDREAFKVALAAFKGWPTSVSDSLEIAITAYLTQAGEGAVPVGCNPNAVARIRSIADTLDRARAIQDPDWAFLHGVADAIAKIAAPHPTRQDGAMCQTCQGNGEIVTDWDRYMKGNTDANGDEAVAECPDCNGSGKVSQDGAREGEPLTFIYRNWRGEVAERKVIPLSVHYGATEWHPEPQWLMRAFDLDKQAERDFAMADMSPDTAPDEAVEAERSQAAKDVVAERRRQVEAEGWTARHDDKYQRNELLRAAFAYRCYGSHPKFGPGQPPGIWPWAKKWWKPRTKRENLVRAGALCLAERDLVYRNFACPPMGGDNFRIHSEPDKLDPADDAYVQYLAIIAEIERLDRARSRRDGRGGV